MNSARQIASVSKKCMRQPSRRFLHATPSRHDITHLQMPAMSPTMTEGGIASWKKQPGESFIAGDVLLEIETDKATIDVEAQDDGIMGKIIAPDGTKAIPVGKIIALLAQEGDDISNLEVPAESSSSAPPPPAKEAAPSHPPSAPRSEPEPPKAHLSHPPSHSRTLFPSVQRLLVEYGVSEPEKIKGTGVRGMLTKGDVLTFLGKASGPLGTYKEPKPQAAPSPAQPKKDAPKILDGAAIRQLIVSNMLKNSVRPLPKAPAPDFDSIISDYLPAQSKPPTKAAPSVVSPKPKHGTEAYFDGLF